MGLKLYVVIRSDLESMTPGKAAAQVAHAASQAAWIFHREPAYQEWANEPQKHHGANRMYAGFGTTIVLDGGSFEDTFDASDTYDPFTESHVTHSKYPPVSGVVKDPTYPVRDGKKTHLVDIVTCWWVLVDPDQNDQVKGVLSQYKLYNGNSL